MPNVCQRLCLHISSSVNEVLGNHLKDSAWLAYACRGRFPVPDDCWQIPKVRTKFAMQVSNPCVRRGSNPQPSAPEADALSS
jgi:hypothetical protein